MAALSAESFDPTRVNLSDPNVDPAQVICALTLGSGNEYNGNIGARISSIFVIFFVSTGFTIFPLLATRQEKLRIPAGVYLLARYFGAGVIIATAFIHLLDPAYEAIGGNSCVGMTGNWASYAWCPALVLAAVCAIFIIDLWAERYVQAKYSIQSRECHQWMAGSDTPVATNQEGPKCPNKDSDQSRSEESSEAMRDIVFRQQIAAFLILEFGIIFHSVIIGMNLGVAGDEFSTLYPVLVFHQSFEGLGIGARMCTIPFAKKSWLPWILCLAYGLTTPIAIAIGLGVRTSYAPESYTANVVSGVFDSLSAGILIYSGLVEILARDFFFDPQRTQDNKKLSLMVCYTMLGAGIMALLGKWA